MDKEMLLNFRKNMKVARTEKGLKQNELGLPENVAMRIESGATKWPKYDDLKKIANTLGLKLLDMFKPYDDTVFYTREMGRNAVEWLEAERRKRKISRMTFCEKILNIELTTYTNYTGNEKRCPMFETLYHIKKVLGVPISVMVEGSGGHENVEKYKQFMREYKKLADKREKSATAMVDRWAAVADEISADWQEDVAATILSELEEDAGKLAEAIAKLKRIAGNEGEK